MANQKIDLAQSDEALSEEAKKERRSLWMVRSFLLILTLSVCVNVILILALKSLLPLERVQPFFLKVEDKKDQVIRVMRPDTSDLNMRAVSEALLRQYLLNRLSIVPSTEEMENRWGIDGIISWSSSTPVYQEFAKTTPAFLKQAKDISLVRSVVIRSLTPFKQEKNGAQVWRANVELADMMPSADKPQKTYWDVFLRVEYQPFQRGIPEQHRLKNPMGFRVVNYTMKQINNTPVAQEEPAEQTASTEEGENNTSPSANPEEKTEN